MTGRRRAGPGEHAGTLFGVLFALVIAALLWLLLFYIPAHAQPEPTVVVTSPAPSGSYNISAKDFTWAGAAGYAVARFFDTVNRHLERLLNLVEKWLDRTKGRIAIDFKKQITQTTFEEPTGPIHVPDRRRNGSLE